MTAPTANDWVDLDDQIRLRQTKNRETKGSVSKTHGRKEAFQSKADDEIRFMRAALKTPLWAADRDSYSWAVGEEPETEPAAQ